MKHKRLASIVFLITISIFPINANASTTYCKRDDFGTEVCTKKSAMQNFIEKIFTNDPSKEDPSLGFIIGMLIGLYGFWHIMSSIYQYLFKKDNSDKNNT